MTQGTLLNKMYEKTNINDILKILTIRRFEDGCIRQECRKFMAKEDVAFRQNRIQNTIITKGQIIIVKLLFNKK